MRLQRSLLSTLSGDRAFKGWILMLGFFKYNEGQIRREPYGL
jgi:hypothetical protein